MPGYDQLGRKHLISRGTANGSAQLVAGDDRILVGEISTQHLRCLLWLAVLQISTNLRRADRHALRCGNGRDDCGFDVVLRGILCKLLRAGCATLTKPEIKTAENVLCVAAIVQNRLDKCLRGKLHDCVERRDEELLDAQVGKQGVSGGGGEQRRNGRAVQHLLRMLGKGKDCRRQPTPACSRNGCTEHGSVPQVEAIEYTQCKCGGCGLRCEIGDVFHWDRSVFRTVLQRIRRIGERK